MSSILEQVRSDLKLAMKEKNSLLLTTVRAILKECKEKEISLKSELDDDAVISVIDKLVKQSNESVSDFEKAGRNELVEHEKLIIDNLSKYLPAMPSSTELEQIVDQVLAKHSGATAADTGKIMAELKNALPARSDLKFVSNYLRSQLSK